jgi:hypothetical protein
MYVWTGEQLYNRGSKQRRVMCMYVCMCVYIYACVCVYIYVYVCVCVWTGEQLYNWGLKQRGVVAFFTMWTLTCAQAVALGIDKFCGVIGQFFGADYGKFKEKML